MSAGQIDFRAAEELLNQKKRDIPGSGAGGMDVNFAKLENASGAQMKIRFLPPLENERVPGMDVFKHFIPGKQYDAIHGNPTCLKTNGLECPICQVLNEYRDRFKGSKWFADFSGRSFYTNVIIRNSDEYPKDVVHLLRTPPYTGVWLLECLCNPELGDITDVLTGADVTLKREKKDGKITRTISLKSTPLHEDKKIVESILNSLYDCKKIWREPDENYLKAMEAIALDLREIIENRIIGLQKEAGKDVRVHEVYEAKEARKSSRNYRPDCYGEFDEVSRECRRCENSEDCERRSR